VVPLPADLDEQKRVISVLWMASTLSIYVPNGSSVGSEIRIQAALVEGAAGILAIFSKEPAVICVCGDFNIYLENRDIPIQLPRSDHGF